MYIVYLCSKDGQDESARLKSGEYSKQIVGLKNIFHCITFFNQSAHILVLFLVCDPTDELNICGSTDNTYTYRKL